VHSHRLSPATPHPPGPCSSSRRLRLDRRRHPRPRQSQPFRDRAALVHSCHRGAGKSAPALSSRGQRLAFQPCHVTWLGSASTRIGGTGDGPRRRDPSPPVPYVLQYRRRQPAAGRGLHAGRPSRATTGDVQRETGATRLDRLGGAVAAVGQPHLATSHPVALKPAEATAM
jgi:hypothetical protein